MTGLILAAAFFSVSITRAEVIVREDGFSSVKVEIPVLGRPAYDAPVARRLREDAADFQRRMKDLVDGSTGAPKMELTVETAAYHSEGIDFVLMEQFVYTGGAHGTDSYLVDAVDPRGRILKFSDLFVPVRALPELSRRCRDLLPKDPELENHLEERDLLDGTAPKIENLGRGYLDGPDWIVLIDEYQIGNHLLGNPRVSIPCRELLPVMKPVLARACRGAGGRGGRR